MLYGESTEQSLNCPSCDWRLVDSKDGFGDCEAIPKSFLPYLDSVCPSCRSKLGLQDLGRIRQEKPKGFFKNLLKKDSSDEEKIFNQ